MCLSGGSSTPLPPVAAAPPTIADASVQTARNDAQRQAAAGGLGSTQLTSGLAATGQGNKKLAGGAGNGMSIAS